ncbi:amidohydrolase [Leifsonia sp. Leaf264]|uniref:amidohydrolase n=1 Tax=Leifsonia sp. Leaf264 TaxID=1736314 RepID=UPI0006FCBBB0|nr:amidohydrolase [Leifsonia sp. Leaf264]KQO96796.1 hypothetical protein ASF30_17055 [Leifsonia sp. Leaf264]
MSATCELLVLGGAVLTPEVLGAGTVSGAAAAAAGYVAISGGVIVGVGPAADAADWSAERIIDLGDATIASGFIDAHIHPIMGLQMTRGVDLSGLMEWDQVRAALAEHISGCDDPWVFGWGLDPNAFGSGEASFTLFDGIDCGRPVYVTLFDGHSAVVSREALRIAGITGREIFADASSVVVDSLGAPTGLLLELSAQALLWPHLPEQTFADRVDALEALFRGMAESGLVAGQMLDLSAPDSFELLEAVEARAELGIRLRISPFVMPGFTDADLDQVVDLQSTGGRRWQVKGVKLMIDGTIDNGTAWLFEPDARGESTDSLWLDEGEYRRAVAYLHDRGIPTTTHAIGDKGIAFVAETLAALDGNGTQHRIEHIETLPDEVLDTIANAGIAASMQPTHCTHYSKADHSDNWSTRLGDERADRAWRIGDLRRRGVIVTLGSDWPIAPYDPRASLGSAVLRRPTGRLEVEPVLPEQAISAAAAVEGYTSEYWRSVGEDGGRIEVGQRADLTVFADNPLTTHPDVFAESPVLLTVIDGEVVVDRVAVR